MVANVHKVPKSPVINDQMRSRICEKLFNQLDERLDCLKIINNTNESAETHYLKKFFMSTFEVVKLVLVKYSVIGPIGIALLTFFTPVVEIAFDEISTLHIGKSYVEGNENLSFPNYHLDDYPVCYLNESSLHQSMVEGQDFCPSRQYFV